MNKKDDGSANDQMMLAVLREILLKEDRKDIAEVRDMLENSDKLSEKVSPIIEYHVETLKRKFPREYQKQVEKIIEKKLKASQDELLNVVYPVMGKMVRKYVNHQFISLKEGIDERLKKIFSTKGLMNRIRSMIFGVKEGDLILGDLAESTIEEVYIIERDSGILLGHYSKQETIDRDVIAGMLTAIKSFVEDAFSKKRQDLEMIEYGTYKIYIQSFHLYYAAIVLNGAISTTEKDKLSALLLDFADNEMKNVTSNGEIEQDHERISNKLAEYFDKSKI